jgi:hypothetical protein
MPEFSEAMRNASSEAGQQRALEHLRKLGGPRYSVDSSRRGGILRIDADGSRTRGRFVRRRFIVAPDD